jgi:hypothetical protein
LIGQNCSWRVARAGPVWPAATVLGLARLPHGAAVMAAVWPADCVGTVEGANLVKLHRLKPKVSYLAYPEFDGDPALAGALVVPLNSGVRSQELGVRS